jgi:hypothetical protein
MSEPIFFPDPQMGDFVVSSNGHYDHAAGIWFKPWTDKPDRVAMGYRIDKHPDGDIIAYTYLVIDVEAGMMRWHYGDTGRPESDPVIFEVTYR